MGFPSTHWSLLQALAAGDLESARAALEVVCRVYWAPIYAAVRRSGFDAEEARDLTQEFFVHLLDRGGLTRADRSKGRFRSFLLGCLRNFLGHERQRRSAAKRAPDQPVISIDGIEAEHRFRLEPSDGLTPEQVFEHQWAATVVGRAVQRLEAVSAARPTAVPFAELRKILLGDDQAQPYGDIARSCGTSVGAVKMAASRVRERFGRCLRAEIEPTVASAEEVEDELRMVLESFRQSGMSLTDLAPPP